MNKFEQVSSDGHQMSQAGVGSQVGCLGWGSHVLPGYKLTHTTFMPVMVTPSSIPHSAVQEINKETPFPAAKSTAELQVLPFMIRICLPIG